MQKDDFHGVSNAPEVMLSLVSFPHTYSITLFTCFLMTSTCIHRTPISLLQFEMTVH